MSRVSSSAPIQRFELWRTASKLAALAMQGKVYGVDFSDASVAASKKTNVQWITGSHFEIREGSVSQLPCGRVGSALLSFADSMWWA